MQMERTGVSVFNGLGLNFLTHDDLDTIHHGACQILKHTGVLVEHEEAADRFQSAGAFVTRAGKNWIAKIPEWLVNESLSNTPKSVTYYARDPKKDFLLENNRVGFGTFGEQVNIIDPDTRVYRTSTKQDCCKVYRLIDALDELAFCQRTICPGDQSPATQAVHNFHALITHNSKHITIGMVNKPSVDVIVKMAAAATGGMDKLREKPICTCSCCVTSPLILTQQCCEILIAAVESGINVDSETMALDLIHEIGPGGTFLDHRHTFERTRTQSTAQLFDRSTRETWMDTIAGKDLTERAYAKATAILENHQPSALPDGTAETINSLLDEFETQSKK